MSICSIIVAVVATRGFDVRGLARSARLAFARIGVCTRHGWAIDAHLFGGILARTGDWRMGVRVPGVARDLGWLQVRRCRLIRDERFDGFLG